MKAVNVCSFPVVLIWSRIPCRIPLNLKPSKIKTAADGRKKVKNIQEQRNKKINIYSKITY